PLIGRDVVSSSQPTSRAELLERVLDKRMVNAGDITLFLGGVQLLALKIRRLVASIDKAQEIGINWWQFDPALSLHASARAKELGQSETERNLLKERLDRLERLLPALPQEAGQKCPAAGQRSSAASAYVLDPEGRMIAELKQLAQRPLQQLQEDVRPQALERAAPPEEEQRQAPERAAPQEEEQRQAPERAAQPEAVQAEQPAGAGPLV